jgi:hypothetical protein
LQRTAHLPDATVKVLQGILFVVILASETFYGRWNWLPARPAASRAGDASKAPSEIPEPLALADALLSTEAEPAQAKGVA